MFGVSVSDGDWFHKGQKELFNALNRKENHGVAKNIILFIGDGMGMSTITSSRIYQGQMAGKAGEENTLAFEHLPFTGLSKVRGLTLIVRDGGG